MNLAVTVLPTTTLKSHLVAILREAIISGKFKPGDRLNETRLAREWKFGTK